MVVILTGGPSAEREVSFATAKTIQDSLLRQGVEHVTLDPARPRWLEQLIDLKPAAVILALHGTFGEDGKVQQILKSNKIAHTGSSAKVAALTFNKLKTKKRVAALGVAVPQTYASNRRFDHAVVVKPNRQGSSYGVSIVHEATELPAAIKLAEKYDEDGQFMIEEYIKGTELTCGVVESVDGIKALPIVEIVPKAQFFDYQAKYNTESGCQEICPARISPEMTEKIQKDSIMAYKKLGTKQYARLDWILHQDKPYFLEINTLPGMTPTSLITKELAAAGIDFDDFIKNILATAL